MRRKSIVGPLLLIAAGALFLMNTLRPELPVIDILARYWPFLLIIWGALRLVEIAIWAARSRPLPAAGIGAGEWVAVIFICIIGSGLFFVNRHRPWHNLGILADKRIEIFGHAYDYPVEEQKKPAANITRLVIENLRGTARVTGADVKEVTVSGHKTVRAFQEKDAIEADRKTPLELAESAGQLTIRTNQDRIVNEERHVSTDLDITVPKGITVEARSRNGDFEISDIAGSVDVKSDNSDIRLQNIGGDARLDVRHANSVRAEHLKGSLEIVSARGRDLELNDVQGQVTISGSFSGDLVFENLAKPLRFQDPRTDLKVERIPGRIDMDLREFNATNVVGPITLSCRSRDVIMDQFTQALNLTVQSGDVTLRPAQLPLPKIEAATRNGDLQVALPQDAKFELKARTDRGEITNEFGAPLQTEASGRGATAAGSLGQGPLVSLVTERGSITITKDSGGPMTTVQKNPRKRRIDIQAGDATIHLEKN